MSVDGVNNSSNAGLYCASGAVLGAGAGAAAGYLTKPFLKDGAPTDSFMKTLGENLVEDANIMTPMEKKIMTEVVPGLEKMANANNVEELYNLYGEMVDKLASGKNLEEFQEMVSTNNEMSRVLGMSIDDEKLAQIMNASSLDEAKNVIKNDMKQGVEMLGFENIKAGFSKNIKFARDLGIPLTPKDLGEIVWKHSYDSTNKKIIEEGSVAEEVISVIKKTMHSFQGKAALMYGAIGAAVLGVAGYLCGGIGANKEAPETPKTTETPEKIDAQA